MSERLSHQVLAVGDATNNVTGINKMMLPWLQQRKGNRFGIVLFDFFDSEPGLVEAAIGLSVTTNSTTSASSVISIVRVTSFDSSIRRYGKPTTSGSNAPPSAFFLLRPSVYLITLLVCMLSCF